MIQKDGSLTAITLSVTKVTVANDFSFIGLIKKAKDGLIGTDENGNIIYSTDTVNILFGYSESDLKDKNIGCFINGPSIRNEDVESSIVYQYTEKAEERLVKPIATGIATVPILNKGKKIIFIILTFFSKNLLFSFFSIFSSKEFSLFFF